MIGFTPHDLRVEGIDLPLAGGIGRNWETIGAVPDLPGLYAFTVISALEERIAYVGLTTHLPMVTHGVRLGLSRPGQRYGRPKWAGHTRQRINVCVTAEVAAGNRVRHWVRPLPEARLRSEEEVLIRRWHLREVGWNRG